MDRLSSGIPHLDDVLGGGIPRHSVLLIAGAPGTGKTVFTQHIVYANASPEAKALVITTLSEPLERMIRYMQRFTFFDMDKVQREVIYEDIGPRVVEADVEAAVDAILDRVADIEPAFLVVDSLKALTDVAPSAEALRRSLYRLVATLTTRPCTVLLVGEYGEDVQQSPEASIVDGIIELRHQALGMGERRTLQVRKLRGSAYRPGEHAYTITEAGFILFPRLVTPERPLPYTASRTRVRTGIAGLDALLHGGFLEGTSVLVAGDPGVGKTVTALHFLLNGARQGEPGVYVSFQEDPNQLRQIARNFGFDVDALESEGRVRLMYRSPVEINPDALALDLTAAATRLKARRVVIDSVRDLEAGTYHDPYRFFNYVYSLVQWFKDRRITVMMTSEIGTMFGNDLVLTGYGISHIADTLLVLRYAPGDGRMARVLTVLASRGSSHSTDVREFHISEARGVEVGDIWLGGLTLLDTPGGGKTPP